MIKKIVIIFGLLHFVLAGCKQNDFEEALFRDRSDPFYDVPVTESFSKLNTVYLSWHNDAGCDEFYLMRAEDLDSLNETSWICIYRGLETSYTDNNLLPLNRYIYRLDKRRGNKRFTGKEYSFGISADTVADENEDNDSQESAKRLECDFNGNLSCVKYINSDRNNLDRDWFYVEIPAHRKAKIAIAEDDGTAANEETDLLVSIPGKIPFTVLQNNGFYLENTSEEQKRIYFMIYPNSTELFVDASYYYTTIGYKVALIEIVKY